MVTEKQIAELQKLLKAKNNLDSLKNKIKSYDPEGSVKIIFTTKSNNGFNERVRLEIPPESIQQTMHDILLNIESDLKVIELKLERVSIDL